MFKEKASIYRSLEMNALSFVYAFLNFSLSEMIYQPLFKVRYATLKDLHILLAVDIDCDCITTTL